MLDRIGRWRRLQVSWQLVSQRRFDMCLDNSQMVDKMTDTTGLKLIGLAFAIVTFAVVTATAAVVANVDAERLDVQSTLVAR